MDMNLVDRGMQARDRRLIFPINLVSSHTRMSRIYLTPLQLKFRFIMPLLDDTRYDISKRGQDSTRITNMT